MTALEKVILVLVLFWAVIGFIRWHHWSKKERQREHDRKRPRSREMNKTEF